MCLVNKNIEFTCNVEVVDGKKKLYNLPNGWQNLTKSVINEKHNAICILTGKINNLTIVDFDSKEVWDKYKHFCQNTFIENSHSGFWHAYFQYDSDLQKTTIEKIDIINEGKNKMCIKGKPLNDISINKIPIEFKKILMAKSIEKIENKKSTAEPKINSEFENLEKIQELVNILTEKEADNRESWIQIGFAIKNILESEEEAKDIYKAFSRLSKKYNLTEFNLQWEKFKDNSNSKIGTILHYTKNYKKQMKIWNSKWFVENEIIIENVNKLNLFDCSDNYNFYTFKDHIFKTLFKDRSLAIKYINENLYKVCVRVGDKIVIKLPFNENKSINSIQSFSDKDRSSDKVKFWGFLLGAPKLFKVDLKDFLEEYPTLINSFENINTDFITDDTIINNNDFYISQPCPTKYINLENRDNNIIDMWNLYIKEVYVIIMKYAIHILING